jgi:hypothetical protein
MDDKKTLHIAVKNLLGYEKLRASEIATKQKMKFYPSKNLLGIMYCTNLLYLVPNC